MEEFLKAVIEIMKEDGGSCGLVDIVDRPKGGREDLTGLIDHIYVEQRSGVCEDDYYGEIYIPIGKGKYLKCWYVC
jgi:hypothetical protein